MKSIRAILIFTFFSFLTPITGSASHPASGFFLPDSVREMTLQYRTVKGLIVLPVAINDSIHVNLVLDTGCRNLILFGKNFRNLFRLSKGRSIRFSGLGSGRSVTGRLSVGNQVTIHEVLGRQIPVVIVDTRSLFGRYHDIHGVIGYDIFLKFEIQLDASRRTVTFRPASISSVPAGYSKIPMEIEDARPIMKSWLIIVGKDAPRNFELMIDTGSSLGLLLKTTNIAEYYGHGTETVLGIGINGPVRGYQTISKKLILQGLEMKQLPTGIISSDWHDNASIGMEILKDYIVILNYSKAYACFKPNA